MFWYWHWEDAGAWAAAPAADANTNLPWWLLLGPAMVAVVGVVIGSVLTAWFSASRAKKDREAVRDAFWVDKRLELASDLIGTAQTVHGLATGSTKSTLAEVERTLALMEQLNIFGARAFMMFEGVVPKSATDTVSACAKLVTAKSARNSDPTKVKQHEDAIRNSIDAIANLQVDLRRVFTDKAIVLPSSTTSRKKRRRVSVFRR